MGEDDSDTSAVILHLLPMTDYTKTRLYGFYSLESGKTLETDGSIVSNVVMGVPDG